MPSRNFTIISLPHRVVLSMAFSNSRLFDDDDDDLAGATRYAARIERRKGRKKEAEKIECDLRRLTSMSK